MHDTLTGYGVQNLGKSKLRGMWESITRRRWEGLEVLYRTLAVVDVHTFRERDRERESVPTKRFYNFIL